MTTTFSHGDEDSAPFWLFTEFENGAKQINGGDHRPLMHARIETADGPVYSAGRTMDAGAVGVFEFISRFVAEASRPGVTRAEIGFTHHTTRPLDPGSQSEDVDLLAGIGLYAGAVARSLHLDGACSSSAWCVLRVLPAPCLPRSGNHRG